jgi:hypothetical protein
MPRRIKRKKNRLITSLAWNYEGFLVKSKVLVMIYKTILYMAFPHLSKCTSYDALFAYFLIFED